MNNYTKKTLIWSLVLFTASSIIGIIPLVFTLITYHLHLSKKEENKVKADKLKKIATALIVVGYIALAVTIVLSYFYIYCKRV